MFNLDTINIDRVTAIQISGPFGEIVTLSFDLWYWKGAQFTSIMWDVITYPCHTCVHHAYTITSPQYFWSVTTYYIYACRWKYTTSSMTFWPSDSRLLMKVFLCDSLLFECGTIKYWIFVCKVKVAIISKRIVSWDARISNYTTTASPQGSVGCD